MYIRQRWLEFHDSLRSKFGGRYGAIEFPSELTATQLAEVLAPVPHDILGNRRGVCAICLTRPAICAFMPCGHRCVCASCARKWTRGRQPDSGLRCVLCNSQASDWIRIYDT